MIFFRKLDTNIIVDSIQIAIIYNHTNIISISQSNVEHNPLLVCAISHGPQFIASSCFSQIVTPIGQRASHTKFAELWKHFKTSPPSSVIGSFTKNDQPIATSSWFLRPRFSVQRNSVFCKHFIHSSFD